jgi:hypothetical protein
MEHFCAAIQETYGETYLRAPNEEDLKKILAENAARGFPGCIGSLDCMHWAWKNCPTSLSGQYEGKEKTPTIVLEATTTKDTWIWHSFFGTAGALNDKNILDRSPLFESTIAGTGWGVEFELEGHVYKMPYYLVDGIYYPWSTLIQSKSLISQDAPTKFFTKCQEGFRKDIERAFGILQGQFKILKEPAMGWYPGDLHAIMNTCIILHNMIVESRTIPKEYPPLPASTKLIPPRSEPYSLREQRIRGIEMRSEFIHTNLTNDLISHLWKKNHKDVSINWDEALSSNQGGINWDEALSS